MDRPALTHCSALASLMSPKLRLTPAVSAIDDVFYIPTNLTAKPQNTESCVSTRDKMYESLGLSTPKAIPVSSGVTPSNATFISRTVHTFFSKKSRTPASTKQFAPDETDVGHFTSGIGDAEDIPPPLYLSKNTHRSFRAVRRTVSHILHREPKEKDEDLLFSSARTVPTIISSPRALKSSKAASHKVQSSSPSIPTQRSRRSAKRLTISPPPRLLAEQQAQALARKQHIRRSRSFSEYANVLTNIADDCSEVYTDAGLDEVTMEAQEVMKDLQRKQVFARIRGVNGSTEAMFERGVETM